MTPRERLFALEQFGIKLGLDNITAILNALDRPDRAYPTLHVGGTNGKGSVSAMVERGLRAAGHRTGRYTSPHLVSIEERIAIDGISVDGKTFDAVTAEVLSVVDQLLESSALPHLPTFFEATTAIAFEIFRRAQVTSAVIEVGLGGRFDATNVIAPVVTAITSIALDHERHLGRTVEAIAFEKAGIIKPGVPVVIGEMAAAPYEVIANAAMRQNAPLIHARPGRSGMGTAVSLALAGAHQHHNAAVAVATLRCVLQDDAGSVRAAVVSGLSDVDWPARLEWLRMPDGHELLVDAAHNPAGAQALADYVRAEAFPMPMIVGVMRDKDAAAIAHALSPAVSRFLTVNVDSPRAMPATDLAQLIGSTLPGVPCTPHDDISRALDDAMARDSRVIVAGSIFLVGPLRSQLIARGARTVRYPSKASLFYLD